MKPRLGAVLPAIFFLTLLALLWFRWGAGTRTSDPDRGDAVSPEEPAALSEDLTAWSERYAAAATEAEREDLAAEMLPEVRKRAVWMTKLLRSHPEDFLRAALPEETLLTMPEAFRPYLERHISGIGFYGVYCALPKPGEAGVVRSVDGMGREVLLDAEWFSAHPTGAWKDRQSLNRTHLVGVALGEDLVLDDAPGTGNALPSTMLSPNQSGGNTMLYYIARFSDEAADPISSSLAVSRMSTTSEFLRNNSGDRVFLSALDGGTPGGGLMDIVFITLPQPKSYGATYNAQFSKLLADARAQAALQGFSHLDYNLDVVVTTNQSFSYAGRAYLFLRGAHLVNSYTSLRTAGHEIGHNLGLSHARYWRTDSLSPIGKDSVPGGYVSTGVLHESIEYGHYFSIMGGQSGTEMDDPTKPHFSPLEQPPFPRPPVRPPALSTAFTQKANS